jgi:tricorn protease
MSDITGYYRYPTIYEDEIVFVSEDDLWQVEASGGRAFRLTANLGKVSNPHFSPDGKWLAFTGEEEGHPEVYVMPADGGQAKRLTYNASNNAVVGWHGDKIVFSSNFAQGIARNYVLYEIDLYGEFKQLSLGPARSISFGENGMVMGRNTGDPARWKRYRGGTAGVLWIDPTGDGEFHQFLDLEGNFTSPMWINDRIYFICDHEGIGNIYSALPNGDDLKKHTDHKEFYVRNATTDGKKIVYHAGADIYAYDIASDSAELVNIEYHSPRVQTNRKFVNTAKYLEEYNLCKEGSRLALNCRGKSFVMGNWEGAVIQNGVKHGVRYRHTNWLNDAERVVVASDEDGEYHLEIHAINSNEILKKFPDLDIGIPYSIKVSPKNDHVAIINHRHELLWVDLESGEMKRIDQNKFSPMGEPAWSPDGRWIAYSCSLNHQVKIIKIYGLETGEIEQVTEPVLHDTNPVFDPEGKYLYFISYRIFNPVYDSLHFDLNFPKGGRPYLITLQKDTRTPFEPEPHCFESEKDKMQGAKKEENGDEEEETLVEIDFDGIKERMVAFPVEESQYGEIAAIKNKVFYTKYEVEGALGRSWQNNEPPAKAQLTTFDMKSLEEDTLMKKITNFQLSQDGSTLAVRIGNKLRVIKANRSPKESLPKGKKADRKTGWINLSRVKVSIDPVSEWTQMYDEIWRLQREYFWNENMSDIDWQRIYERYLPLVERVGSRSEFSDLAWEVQGELGTSHAYEFGGDYRSTPQYKIGLLGADYEYDEEHNAYRITHIVNGDVWKKKMKPPLKTPGVNISEGMLLLAIGGEAVSKEKSPYKLLVNQAGQEVQLTVAESDGSNPRKVTVKTIPNESTLRYREWVERNRAYVHEKTDGKVGYVHVPDMGAHGYAEFHRYFLAEYEYDGLVVDVRFNGGGHVSSLLLEKLNRQRIGFDYTRWMGYEPYPNESVAGPIVALTNEHAGSDGDIFSHSFKLMGLGKLIGKRTWGGVIGIWPRNWLVDGTITTQPEFSFWFKDVGWGVENYGTDPDIEIDITPQDYAKGADPQLDKAIDVVLEEIKENPPLKPDFSHKPKLTLPEE